jgi:ABC-2 type transport system permease protein
MNKNLYLKELKRNRKNLITWSIIVFLFTFLMVSIYPFMIEMGDTINMMMEELPKEFGDALGMNEQAWSKVAGFYSTYYGIYLIVLVAIYTTSTGARILSKEERDGTADFLMTKPISRKSLFMTKMFALFSLSMIIYLVQTLTAMIGFLVFDVGKVDWAPVFIMHAHGLVLILFFTCLGVLVSMFFRPKKNFMGMVVGIVFGSYFINAISKAASEIEWIGYISPFYYMDFSVSDPNYSFQAISALVLLIIGCGVLLFSYRNYIRKNINA